MNIDPSVLYKLIAVVGVFSAIFAAGVSALFQLINGWRERIAADKRHLRDLALKTAIEKFKIETDLPAHFAKSGKEWKQPPFDAYVIHAVRLMEIAQDTSLSTDEVARKLSGLRDFSRTAVRTMRGQRQTGDSDPD